MGGANPGERRGGRKKGTPNKKAQAMAKRTAELAAIIEPLLDDAFGGDAHAYLMTVYKDKRVPRTERIDAAGKAIGYEKPKLAAVDVSSKNEHVIHAISDQPFTDAEWEAKFVTN